jgi:hypothetical protein
LQLEHCPASSVEQTLATQQPHCDIHEISRRRRQHNSDAHACSACLAERDTQCDSCNSQLSLRCCA